MALPLRAFVVLISALTLASPPAFAQAQQRPRGEGTAPGQTGATQGPAREGQAREGQPQASALRPLPADAITEHTITIGSKPLRFKATAGTVRLFDAQQGTPQADVAFIAYELIDADKRTRPLTFAFNGGPGYASGWLNLGALGPWRLAMDGDAVRPSAAQTLTDNAETWLDFTDLVFVDPPGTGYSRILGNEEVRKSFWSVGGDISALSVTIRRYVEANDRMASPKFIAGESYGGFRAPKIAHNLQTDQGVRVDGAILLSPVLDFPSFNASLAPTGLIARLPSMVATARETKKPITRSDLADVEAYATGEYLADIMKGRSDTQAIERMSRKVAEMTGLEAPLVRRLGGRVPVDVFAREFRRNEGRVSSLYDGNITSFDPAPYSSRDRSDDQMRLGLHAPITSAMVDLYRNRLKWVVENGRYAFYNEQASRAWDWGRGNAEAVGDLTSALALDPSFRVLVAHGLTDLVTPYFGSRLVLDQIAVPGRADRLRFTTYPGGHMFYGRDASRKVFRDDVKKLIEGQ